MYDLWSKSCEGTSAILCVKLAQQSIERACVDFWAQVEMRKIAALQSVIVRILFQPFSKWAFLCSSLQFLCSHSHEESSCQMFHGMWRACSSYDVWSLVQAVLWEIMSFITNNVCRGRKVLAGITSPYFIYYFSFCTSFPLSYCSKSQTFRCFPPIYVLSLM